jgi:hypothetical protein
VYPQVISSGIYSLIRRGWENPKPWFWHFEPWFSKVLEIFENMLLYITVGSFGNGGRRGRFLYPPLVRWERDAIRPSFFRFGRLRCFVEIRSWFVHLAGAETMVVQPPSQTDTGRLLLHRPLPPPPPKTPITNWQTYWINIYDIDPTNRMKFSNSCIIVVRMTKIVEIWSCKCNIPKSSCKWLQVARSRKWTGYILADFY